MAAEIAYLGDDANTHQSTPGRLFIMRRLFGMWKNIDSQFCKMSCICENLHHVGRTIEVGWGRMREFIRPRGAWVSCPSDSIFLTILSFPRLFNTVHTALKLTSATKLPRDSRLFVMRPHRVGTCPPVICQMKGHPRWAWLRFNFTQPFATKCPIGRTRFS